MALKDKTQNHNEKNSLMVDVAMGTVHDVSNSQVQQYVSDVPTGTKAEAVRVKLQPTSRSKAQSLQRSTVTANHNLNPPIRDGLRYVRGVYLTTHDMAENYQRTHNDAFFEQWADLIIDISDPESEIVHSTSELRMSTKLYSKRLAHYYFQYSNAVTMLYASAVNLMIASRYQGNEMMADIAYRTRWGVINSNMVLLDSFPVPKGLVKYLIDNSKYAVGKTSYGADILSMPLWKTDIYGNRGYHSLPVDNMVTTTAGAGTSIAAMDPKNEANNDAVRMFNLVANIQKTIDEYSLNTKTFSASARDGKKSITWSPFMPRLENGGYHVESQGDTVMAAPANLDACDTRRSAIGSDNPFTATLWNNFFYWLDYCITQFPEMMDENSDMYEFGIGQLGLFESAPDVKSIYDGVRNLPNINMNDLLKRMCYKGKNEMNTATIVNFMPFVDGTKSAEAVRTQARMNINFERYDVDLDNIPKMVAQAKSFPGIAPAVFGNPIEGSEQVSVAAGEAVNLPFVMNTIPTVGFEGANEVILPQLDLNPSLVGKFATMFDMACSNSLDEEASSISTLGVSDTFAHDYVTSGDGVVYEEDPTTLHFPVARLIDNTDPYQCGFNLFCSYNSEKKDESVRFFMNSDNYKDDLEVELDGDIDGYTDSTGKKTHRHIANGSYFSDIKYALIFMGTGIFDHPVVTYAKLGACNPLHSVGLLAADSDEAITSRLNVGLNLGNTAADVEWAITAQAAYSGSYSTMVDGTGANAFVGKTTTDPTTVIDYLFSPFYGPVKIMTLSENISGVLQLNPFQSSGVDVQTNSAQKFDAGFVNASHFDLMGKGVRRDVLYNSAFDGPKSWVPFVATFRLKPIIEDVAGRFVFATDTTKDVNIVAAPQFYRTLFNKVRVQFAGSEDVQPFDSCADIKFAQQMESIASIEGETWDMPENNILAAPRRSPKASAGSKSFDEYKKKPNFQPQNSSNFFNAADSSRKVSNRRGKTLNKSHPSDGGSVVDTTPERSDFAKDTANDPSLNNLGSIGAKKSAQSAVIEKKDSNVDEALKSVLG